jgi:peptidoglycan/xylan/chitin deacetylase (PgdA/CDA1 family)
MAWLRWRRYHVLSMSDLVACLREHRLPPARSVIITFDDGYADNYDRAFPVLRRYRFPATVFLVSGAIGGDASWTDDPPLSGRPLLSEAQLEEMLRAGIEVGAHTRTHPSLLELSAPDREREVQGAREDLQRRFGQVIRTFAYPFGDYDADVARVVLRAGFDAACCSRSGVNDPATPPFELRRVEVRGTDSLYRFALMVWHARRGRGGRATRHASGSAARVHA